MNEYYLEKSGGLGDIFWSYYYHDQRFDRAYCNLLKKIKNLEPDCRITYVSCTSNSQVRQFYENNPFIDNLVVLPMSSWTNGSWFEHIQNKKCILNIDGVFYGENKGPVDEFFLSPEENRKFEEIKSGGKYVVIHPFGGCPTRTFVQQNFYMKTVVDEILANGFKCVVVGGNDNRNESFYEQVFTIQNENCENLIDKFTCRLHACLTAHANGFIGIGSCFSVISAIFEIPSLLFYPISWKSWVEGTNPNESYSVIAEKFCQNKFEIEYFENPSCDTKQKVKLFLDKI